MINHPTLINKLNYKELLAAREVIKTILIEKNKPIEIKIINNLKGKEYSKFKDVKYKLDTLCLILTPSKYPMVIKDISDYIGKIIYMPNEICNRIHLEDAENLFNNFLNMYIDTVVKCTHSQDKTYFTNFKNKTFFTTSYKDLGNLLMSSPSILANSPRTLFLFEEVTWEALSILFKLHRIRISGGSHNKRQFLSPLDLRLMYCVRAIQKYTASDFQNPSYLEVYRDFIDDDLDNYRAHLERAVKYSYHRSDSSKTTRSRQYTLMYNLFSKYLKLIYIFDSKLFNEYKEIVFLQYCNIADSSDDFSFYLIINEIYFSLLNKQEVEIEKRILELTQNQSTSSIPLPPSVIQKNRKYSSIATIKPQKDLSISPKSLVPYNNEVKNNFLNTYLSSIESIINNREIYDVDKQKDIEYNWIEFISSKYNDPDYLKRRYSNKLISSLFKAKETLDIYIKKGRVKKTFPTIYPFLNNFEVLLIAFGISFSGVNFNMGYTNICSLIGKKVVTQIFLEYLKNSKKFKNIIKSNDEILLINYFNSDNKDIKEFYSFINFNQFDYIKLGNFLLELLITYPAEIFEKVFDDTINQHKNEVARLKFNENRLESIKNSSIIEPASLPMVCRPLVWTDSEYGGYLTNKKIKQDIVTGSTYHKHTTDNRSNLYKAINKMSSIKFNFNTKLLNFLENEGSYIFMHFFNKASKSEQIQASIQLEVAKTYRNITFYIPLQIDWRGRIYVQPFFANYQGSDLSLSLLEFKDGEPLTEDGLDSLYIYACNLYNYKNLSKASYEDRINWTKDNLNNIINMNQEFMLNAENKFTFTAICLIIRELEIDPTYNVKLPVFLDATCSGIQHLAALMRDEDLAKEVNIVPTEVPADIYETLRGPINEEIRRIGLVDPIYSGLQFVNLSRKNVKQPIMTKTYNVTPYGVKEQLISQFTEILIDNNKNYKVPSIIEGKTVTLNITEVMKIASIIYNSIFTRYPGLNLIYNYFIEMGKILSKLNLPIIWITPSGLKLTQRYSKSRQSKIALRLGGKTNKLVLREMLDKLDARKQSSAIIPNVIHSLDASHIVNIINNSFDYDNYDKPIITVHDCFGTHPNHMSYLSEIVKLEFIKLYTSESFLEKFHERNLQSIKDNGYEIERDHSLGQDYVTYKVKNKLMIPNIPHIGKLDI